MVVDAPHTMLSEVTARLYFEVYNLCRPEAVERSYGSMIKRLCRPDARELIYGSII